MKTPTVFNRLDSAAVRGLLAGVFLTPLTAFADLSKWVVLFSVGLSVIIGFAFPSREEEDTDAV